MEAFSSPGRFFRGNLHTHSTRSDGVLSPQEVCRRYADEGYDFIAITDHFVGLFDYPLVDTKPYRTDRFTTLLGAELHTGEMQNGALWHILAVGLPEGFEPPDAPDFQAVPGQETGPEIARRAREAGAFVAIAHPQWSGLTMEDARSIEAAHAVETYNHGCAVGSDRPDGFHTLDLLLSEGRRLDLCATDDAHFSEPDHFGGWVMVKAEKNDPDLLLEALKRGAYYSSQGPDFHDVVFENDHVVLETSEVVTISVQAQGILAGAMHGEALTEARINLGQFTASPWVRITITDAAGKRAWTNPHWRR